jgi:hypothetical protein
MSNGPGVQVPKHVKNYLKKNDVELDDVDPAVLATLAELSNAELALFEYVGESLEATTGDQSFIIAKIH